MTLSFGQETFANTIICRYSYDLFIRQSDITIDFDHDSPYPIQKLADSYLCEETPNMNQTQQLIHGSELSSLKPIYSLLEVGKIYYFKKFYSSFVWNANEGSLVSHEWSFT